MNNLESWQSASSYSYLGLIEIHPILVAYLFWNHEFLSRLWYQYNQVRKERMANLLMLNEINFALFCIQHK